MNANDRTLLFLPGAGADPGFWRPLGALLPAHWRKRYFGWPGIGHQPTDDGVRGFDDLVAMVESHLHRVEGGDAGDGVDLLGQSMGCAVALRVALNNPTKVRRLVLAVGAGGLPVERYGAQDWRPGYRAEYPHAAPWITEVRLDYSAELPRLAQPTLLLWGDADPISPVAVGEALRGVLANARLHVVPGGDHGLVSERAAEVAPIVARHLGAPAGS